MHAMELTRGDDTNLPIARPSAFDITNPNFKLELNPSKSSRKHGPAGKYRG
jgi:hypothetical protein